MGRLPAWSASHACHLLDPGNNSLIMVLADRPPILLDDAVLREDYVVSDLCARRSQLSLIQACLDPACRKRKPAHIWLHGPSGSGKTATARAALVCRQF